MANPTPGEHPLTEILSHHSDFYGPEASHLIRDIAEHMTASELFAWWEKEIGWDGSPYLALESAREKHATLEARA
jgi:hypothetical protein